MAALRAGDGGAAQPPVSGGGSRPRLGRGGLGSHPPAWVGVPCWAHPEEGARRNGRVLSISGEGPGPDSHREEALGSSEEGSGGPATLNRGGSDVLASPGTARIPPASSLTRRGTGHPRVTQSDAPSSPRSPTPTPGSAGSEDSVGIHRAVPATRRRFGARRGAPGLGEDPLCSHMHAHTQTPAQDVSSLPPW